MYFMMAPDIGPARMPAMAVALMKRAMMRPRRAFGYQYVRYSSTPGKKPASNTPSRKRST